MSCEVGGHESAVGTSVEHELLVRGRAGEHGSAVQQEIESVNLFETCLLDLL